MASYQYLRDIKPEDLQPEPQQQYTRKERMTNWWHYNWKFVLMGAAAVLCGLMLLSDIMSAGPESDYTITAVGPQRLPQELCEALEQALTPYAADRNGDGKVVLTVQSLVLDYDPDSATQNEFAVADRMAAETQLTADFESGTSSLFLLAQPQLFQAATSALLYTDGTDPGSDEDTSAQWRRMVYRWDDCPVLAQITFDSEEDAAWREALSGYYLGRRGCWTDRHEAAMEGSEVLWDKLTQGATPLEK